MFYRINVGTELGESRGYQWRELTLEEFVSIATGTRPLGDTEAQTRDSTLTRADAYNRPMHYLGIWHNGWQTDLPTAEAEALYALAAHERAGA
jgi:hypothetical protein